MFQITRAMFLYAVAPVHMGAGTALGLIDNPIQRAVHDGYPILAGSGLKGAIRHYFELKWLEDIKKVLAIFGPKSNTAQDYAGAVSFTDGVLVAFPVRCLKRGYVYATSGTALARAARLLSLVNGAALEVNIAAGDGEARAASKLALTHDKLILEAFEFTAKEDQRATKAAAWLADKALPQGDAYAFFRDKLKSDLVVLPEDAFGHFVRHATVVEPHVRINDATGTAEDGGLFYTENLPPESLFLSLLMATKSRNSKEDNGLTESQVAGAVAGELDGKPLQIGGDATTGRGQVVLRFVGE